ncbi:MFS transporter [Dactylosporangium sp. NPDC000244]|uniref:MFS transporter n=1 Tax=Dactylosporangium sp. NPDC000244 TaxID=3154365 RepID=UPI003326F4BA
MQLLRLFRRNPAYFRLWLGNCMSIMGDVQYNVAVVWFLVSTTGSAVAGSGIAVGAMLGGMAGGVCAGTTLDAWHPRVVMLLADGVRFLAALAVGVSWLLAGPPPVIVLYALAAVLTFCGTYHQAARSSSIPAVVDEDQLIRAGAAESLGSGLVSAVAWAGSGALIAVLGTGQILLVNAATFLVPLLLVAATRWRHTPAAPEPGARRPMLAAFRWVRRDALVLRMLTIETLHALVSGLVYATLPLFVLVLGGGAGLFGLQGGLSALAILGGSLYLARRADARAGRFYVLGMAVNAAGVLVMAASPSVWPFLAGVLVAGLGTPAWNAARQVIFQTAAPEAVRGRVFAMLETAINVALLPTWAGGAVLADAAGPRLVMLAAPAGYCLILLLVLRTGIARYRTDRPAPAGEPCPVVPTTLSPPGGPA